MLKIEFYNREKEIKNILNILNSQPNLITFVYGPINSGKTELFNYIIKNLSTNFVVFYINLRGRFIKDYGEFIDVLFEVDEKRYENVLEYAKAILKDIKTISGIPIPINLFEKLVEERERSRDVFKYIEYLMTKIAESRIPVLIIDELQVIGDIKINGLLIYKLFNFFIRLTKELHLCHVFAVTSDSLFIEKVYSSAMLQGRSRYLLVDDFDYKTAIEFLKRYGFSDEEVELVWNYFGGKPVYLVEAIRVKHSGESLKDLCEKWLKIRVGQITDLIYGLEEKSKDLFNRVAKILEEFKRKDVVECKRIDRAVEFCVKNNILFFDPVERILKPQSKLDLLAIRRL